MNRKPNDFPKENQVNMETKNTLKTNQFRPAFQQLDKMMLEYMQANLHVELNGDIFIGNKVVKTSEYLDTVEEVVLKVKKLYKDEENNILMDVAKYKNIGDFAEQEIGERDVMNFLELNVYQKLIIIDVFVELYNNIQNSYS